MICLYLWVIIGVLVDFYDEVLLGVLVEVEVVCFRREVDVFISFVVLFVVGVRVRINGVNVEVFEVFG